MSGCRKGRDPRSEEASQRCPALGAPCACTWRAGRGTGYHLGKAPQLAPRCSACTWAKCPPSLPRLTPTMAPLSHDPFQRRPLTCRLVDHCGWIDSSLPFEVWINGHPNKYRTHFVLLPWSQPVSSLPRLLCDFPGGPVYALASHSPSFTEHGGLCRRETRARHPLLTPPGASLSVGIQV